MDNCLVTGDKLKVASGGRSDLPNELNTTKV